jgi:hypothetical protein
MNLTDGNRQNGCFFPLINLSNERLPDAPKSAGRPLTLHLGLGGKISRLHAFTNITMRQNPI